MPADPRHHIGQSTDLFTNLAFALMFMLSLLDWYGEDVETGVQQ